MNKGVLTIDIKNRTFKDSIILDVSSAKGENKLILNLDIRSSLNKVKDFLKDGEIEKSEEELNKSAIYLETHKNHELYNEYCIYKEICSIITKITKEINEDKGELDKFLSLKQIYYHLITFQLSNDVSYFEDTYNECLESLQDYIKDYNLIEMLRTFKKNIDRGEKTSYIMYIVDKLDDIYLYDEEEINLLEELKKYIVHLRMQKIVAYNQNENTQNIIKFLMPYEYRKLIKDKDFNEYSGTLKNNYEDYNELKEDLNTMYALYNLNRVNDYFKFCNIIITLPLRELIMLSNYARQYIIRKLFEKHKNYYTIQEVREEIKEIMKTLNIKQNTNVIPL